MNYIKKGSGNTVVLIHGFCEDHRIWEGLGDALSANYEVIMPDLPGFGDTPVMNGGLSAWASALHDEIIVPHTNGNVVMIGHSMGGYVTLAYAGQFPENIIGFGLFHSTSKADNEEKKAGRTRSVNFVKEHGAAPFVKQLIPGLFAENAEKALVDKALEIGYDCKAEGIISALEAMRERPDRSEVLKAADCPVLIIAGEHDPIMPREGLAELATLPESCLFRILPHSGHMGMFEEPETAVSTVKEFLEEISWS